MLIREGVLRGLVGWFAMRVWLSTSSSASISEENMVNPQFFSMFFGVFVCRFRG